MGAHCSNCCGTTEKEAKLERVDRSLPARTAYHEECVDVHQKGEPASKHEEEALRRGQVRALTHQANAEMKRGDIDAAEASCGKALDLDASDGLAHAGRGGVRLRRGDLRGALEDLNRAIELDPALLSAWPSRADVKVEAGDLRGAISDLNQYLSMAPADADILCKRGMIKLRVDDVRGSIVDFELAIRLGHAGAQGLLQEARAKCK
mmetsp:Transcript_35014/g.98282  ORF Transcript_35014/g.98282 Transcript_35014/m.98282 type:complete len:207 (+) Transcript_35014:88-708(+)